MKVLRDPVSPACTAFAVEIRSDATRFKVGYSETRIIDGKTIVAVVEWHTYKGASGRRLDTPEPGVTLYERSETPVPDTDPTMTVPTMHTSRAGLDFISRWEGEVLRVYKDVAGIATIGVGHVVLPGESFSACITHEQVMDLLGRDVATAEHAVAALGVELSQNEFDALVSFTFNVGTGALAASTLAAKLKAGDKAGAAAEFLRWDKAGGQPVTGLHNRRQAERALFLATPPEDASASPEQLDTIDAGRILEIAKGVDEGREGLPEDG